MAKRRQGKDAEVIARLRRRLDHFTEAIVMAEEEAYESFTEGIDWGNGWAGLDVAALTRDLWDFKAQVSDIAGKVIGKERADATLGPSEGHLYALAYYAGLMLTATNNDTNWFSVHEDAISRLARTVGHISELIDEYEEAFDPTVRKGKRDAREALFMDEKRRYYRERLDEPSLLDHAVELGYDLAVPIGGKRRGGFVCPPGEAACKHAVAVLSQHPGFPNLRILPGDEEIADGVMWGEQPPELQNQNDEERARWIIASGRHYGYSEKVIEVFCRRAVKPGVVKRLLQEPPPVVAVSADS